MQTIAHRHAPPNQALQLTLDTADHSANFEWPAASSTASIGTSKDMDEQ